MIDKIDITKKLTQFFRRTKIDSFFKIIIISYLFDKTRHLENIVGKEEEKGIESLFSFDKTTLNKSVQNMDDFELISFLVIK